MVACVLDWGEDHLYMRDTVTEKTMQLDVPESGCPMADKCGAGPVNPEFQVASSEGSRVFFTDTQKLTADGGEYAEARNGGPGRSRSLRMRNPRRRLQAEDLAPSGAVLGLAPGASEDGSWVYFVSNAVLCAEGAVDGTCPNNS